MKNVKKKIFRDFVFRFDVYDGSEVGNQIYDTNVVEYEFINQGTTLCIINDGLRLYPKFANIEPCRQKLTVRRSEMDITVYNYKFVPLDYTGNSILTPVNQGHLLSQGYATPWQPVFVQANAVEFNRLLVISKIKGRL